MKASLFCLSLFIGFSVAAMAPTATPKSKNTKIELQPSLVLPNGNVMHLFYHPVEQKIVYITRIKGKDRDCEDKFQLPSNIKNISSVKIEGIAPVNNGILTLFLITHNKNNHSIILGDYRDRETKAEISFSPDKKLIGKIKYISIAQTSEHNIAITCALKYITNIVKFRWIIAHDFSKIVSNPEYITEYCKKSPVPLAK
jgi:hypothetical protein